MGRTKKRWPKGVSWLAIATIALLAMPALAWGTPTAPQLKNATLYQGGAGITTWWIRSTDTEAGTLVYSLYRANVPMTLATYATQERVTYTGSPMGPGTWVGETTVTVSPAAGEAASKFTYYYLVEVHNLTTGKKAVSANVSPNVHGSSRTGYSVNSCQLCHSVHGVPPENYLGAATRYKCYRCHGATAAATNYGAQAVRNVQRDFYDYSSQEGAAGASRHYNAQNVADERECTMCHFRYPHTSPYYVTPLTGVYDPTKSYTQLLFVKRMDLTYSFSKDDAPAGNSFCLECHGPNTTTLTYNAGAGAYDRTAGNHTYGASAIHDSTVIYTNNDSHATNPGIQCEACHNKHASAADKLIAYRGDDTRGADVASGTYTQAELCFACHSATSTDSRIAGTYAAPFSWNGLDVKAQFAKASHHPTNAISTGGLSGSWAETNEIEFGDDTLTNTAVSGTGSGAVVQLATIPGGYSNTGSVVSTTVSASTGTLTDWGSLTFNGVNNGGTLLVDVCDSAGTPIVGFENLTAGTTPLDGLTAVAYPTLKLRARMQGNAGAPASVTDDFTHATYAASNFDTNKWTDAYLGGMTDPDAAANEYAMQEGFEGTWTTNFPTAVGTWAASTLWSPEGADSISAGNGGTGTFLTDNFDDGNLTIPAWELRTDGTLNANAFQASTTWSPSGSYSARGGPATTSGVREEDTAESPTFGPLTNGGTLTFNYTYTGLEANSDYMYADYSTNGGTSWTTLWTFAAGGSSTATNASGNLTLPAGTNRVRLRVSTNATTEYGYYDDVTVIAPELVLTSRLMDLTGWSSATVGFQWVDYSLDAGERMYVDYSTNGTTWTNAWSAEGRSNTAYTTVPPQPFTFTIGAPTATTYVRLRVTGADAGEYGYWDDVNVYRTLPATDLWPHEENNRLELKAEGAGFTGAADAGEFVYIDPPAPTDWVSGGDFDLQTQVNAVTAGAAPKTGIMIRRGADTAGALANGASMAGLYVNNGNIVFQYRNAAGNNTATVQTVNAVGTTPVWLRLERRGLIITAKYSTDGNTWTTLGTTATFGAAATRWLVGVALTSGAESTPSTWAQGTFDTFSVTSAAVVPSTITPQLQDWTVTYTYDPPAAGLLTCANCHNVHSVVQASTAEGTPADWWLLGRASNPNNTKTNYAGTHTGGGATAFCLECHDGTAPTATASAATLVPYTPTFTTPASALFPGWNKQATNADWESSAHNNSAVTRMTPECSTCHDPHASDNPRLTALTAYPTGSVANHIVKTRDNTTAYAEEKLCYACHTNSTTPNCAGGACHAGGTRTVALIDVQTAFGQTYRHPVSTSGRHADNETGSDLGPALTDRHAECADCHDPHAARRGLHAASSSVAAEAIRGAIGVKPTYLSPAYPDSGWGDNNWKPAQSYAELRLTGQSTDFEAYLCLKCHSAYSGQPFQVTTASGTYTSTDVAKDFNPSNFSSHNVFGQTTGMKNAFTFTDSGGTVRTITWVLPANSVFLLSPWTTTGTTSMMTCTSCHTSSTTAAKGPHGSSVAWILDPGYVNWTATTTVTRTGNGMSPSNIICSKCHTNLGGTNANWVHYNHANWPDDGGNMCQNCHVKVPHGWKRPRLLGSNLASGITNVSARNIANITTSWNANNCQADCGAGTRHDGAVTAPAWP